jgi:hypothetical protein
VPWGSVEVVSDGCEGFGAVASDFCSNPLRLRSLIQLSHNAAAARKAVTAMAADNSARTRRRFRFFRVAFMRIGPENFGSSGWRRYSESPPANGS